MDDGRADAFHPPAAVLGERGQLSFPVAERCKPRPARQDQRAVGKREAFIVGDMDPATVCQREFRDDTIWSSGEHDVQKRLAVAAPPAAALETGDRLVSNAQLRSDELDARAGVTAGHPAGIDKRQLEYHRLLNLPRQQTITQDQTICREPDLLVRAVVMEHL